MPRNEEFDQRFICQADVVTLPPLSVFEYRERYWTYLHAGCFCRMWNDGNPVLEQECIGKHGEVDGEGEAEQQVGLEWSSIIYVFGSISSGQSSACITRWHHKPTLQLGQAQESRLAVVKAFICCWENVPRSVHATVHRTKCFPLFSPFVSASSVSTNILLLISII